MEKKIYINNTILLSILKNAFELNDFLGIVELSHKCDLRHIVNCDDTLEEIYSYLFEHLRTSDDIKLFHIMLNKIYEFCDNDSFNDDLLALKSICLNESSDFQQILNNNRIFNFNNYQAVFNIDSSYGIRNILLKDDLVKILLLLNCNNNPSEFIGEIEKVLPKIKFDINILGSISELSDGFENRKKEITYHLYCISSEIPVILLAGHRHYRDIGNQLSLDASPERTRETVRNELIVEIDGYSVNCELHTKLRVISSNAPDRIYFCPYLPSEMREEYAGKIFIFKITKHV